jgi:hypothetical protein
MPRRESGESSYVVLVYSFVAGYIFFVLFIFLLFLFLFVFVFVFLFLFLFVVVIVVSVLFIDIKAFEAFFDIVNRVFLFRGMDAFLLIQLVQCY